MLLLIFPCVVATFTTTNALAMEPLGEVAGTAASVFGAFMTAGGALFGFIVAQLYNGTVTPVLWGNCAMGVCALACFVVAENGRLFGRDHSPVDAIPMEAF
jgi:DHA1 family bicyclomycin/chloramphenicol resistance-like MFS transporter